jgi:hypothetical protein
VLSQDFNPQSNPRLSDFTRTNGIATPSAVGYSPCAARITLNRRKLQTRHRGADCFGDAPSHLLKTGGGLLIHSDLFAQTDIRLFSLR